MLYSRYWLQVSALKYAKALLTASFPFHYSVSPNRNVVKFDTNKKWIQYIYTQRNNNTIVNLKRGLVGLRS
jgi:hypothetical protein